MLTTIKNLLTALPLLKQFLALWSEIQTAVHQVEAPGLSGTEKKSLALKVIGDVLTGIAGDLKVAIPVSSVQNIIGILIDAVVYVENYVGRLTHAASSPVPPAAAITIVEGKLAEEPAYNPVNL